MGKKQIRTVADLPKEFSLSKYAEAATFGIGDWLVNLEIRSFCGHTLRTPRSAHTSKEFTRRLLDRPLFPVFAAQDQSDRCRKYPSNVVDFTVADYFFGGVVHAGQGDYREAFERLVSRGQPSEEDRRLLYQPMWEMYKSGGFDSESFVAVNVDIYGNEEKIISDFTDWLRRTRSVLWSESLKKPIQNSDLSGWFRFGVLPYWDLTMWAKAHEVEISQQVMGVALFPDEVEVNVAERVRRVVIPMARPLITEEFTDAFRNQAIAQMLTQEERNNFPEKFDYIQIVDGGWLPIDQEKQASGDGS